MNDQMGEAVSSPRDANALSGWRCVMGVPLSEPGCQSPLPVKVANEDPLRELAHRLFSRILQLWREEAGHESAWQAAGAHYEWLERTRPHPGRERESLHRAWVRAETLKNRSGSRFTAQVLKFTGLPPELDPHRIRRAQKLLRRYVRDVDGHFALSGEGTVDVAPGRYVDSGPCLPGLLLDFVALATEFEATPSGVDSSSPAAAARVMAVELALVRVAQGLQIHFNAAEALGAEPELDRLRAAPTWPLAVALGLLRKPEARKIPWVALLGFTAALGGLLRAEARDSLLDLPGKDDIWRQRAAALLEGLLDRETSTEGKADDSAPPSIARIDQVTGDGRDARGALETAFNWLGLENLDGVIRRIDVFDPSRRKSPLD